MGTDVNSPVSAVAPSSKFFKEELMPSMEQMQTALGTEEKFKKEYGIRTQKQLSVLQTIDSIDKYELSELVKKSGAPYSTVNSLIAKGLLTETEERVMRESEDIFTEEKKDIELNQEQKECLKELKDAISEEKFKSFLLFGVKATVHHF